jgi:hypothetical protein
MKASACLLLSAALGGLLAPSFAAGTPVPTSVGFTLVPNAFSRNPLLTMTVFTDMTEHGRTLPAASKDSPVYFIALDEGMHTMGEQIAGVRSPAPEALQDILFKSLADGGYRPATEGKQPGLVLIYYWGSHYGMDPDQVAMFPEVHQQRVMERAMLVGGRAYRKQIRDEIEFGYTFADRTPKKTFLINQAVDDLYFIVVSAYDHAELAAGRRKLAWRTSMTVRTSGVAMRDGLPPLIVTAADYFGRETPEPVAIHRRARRGTVTLGPMRIVEGGDPRPARRK